MPIENSGVTKYLMDRRARFTIALNSSHYCVSPLVEGELKIPCEIEIYLPPIQKNKEHDREHNLIKTALSMVLQRSEEVTTPTIKKIQKNKTMEKTKQISNELKSRKP